MLDMVELDELKQTNKLLAIDKIITDYANDPSIINKDKEKIYKDILNYFLRIILEYLNIKYDSLRIKDEIFNNDLEESQQRFIAVCLLRLLNANDEFFSPKDSFRNKTFILFDKVFENDIYKYKDVNLTPQTQNYNKESKLTSFLAANEKSMKDSCSISSLNSLNTFKNNFFSNLFSPLHRIIFSCFLPENLLYKEKYAVIFNYINEYLTSDERDKITKYNKVEDIISQFIEEAKLCNTIYCNEYLIMPFERIHKMIKHDFEASPLSKPAELTLKQTEKKYPFNVQGSKFRLSIFVRNQGKGHAFNTEVSIIEHDSNIEFKKKKHHIGVITTEDILIEFDCGILRSPTNQLIIFNISWENFDKTTHSEEIIFEFESQKLHIDWEDLKYEEPYSWEPVESEDKLVGRKEIVNRLWTSIIKKEKVSSFYIHGQKRVGKTSIVKTLKSKIEKDNKDNCAVLYIEGGEYKDLDLSKTITNLGYAICNKVIEVNNRFNGIVIPNFEGALSPLTQFLDKVEKNFPELKILIILDEFDEISSDIFVRGEISDSFFLTIRAISNKSNYGFLLVGGEKMDFIISSQGEQLNKFQSIRVDYFDKGKYFNDFQDLAKKPVENILEFSDKALDYLYNQTAGNPFFTIIVCARLFSLMVDKRDSHVTEIEMKAAIDLVIEDSDIQIFSHFWEDGIKGKANEEEEISIVRRKILIAIANVILKYGEANINNVIDEIIRNSISEDKAKDYLKEFIERQILTTFDNKLDFKINIFKKWLIEKGINCIITSFSDKERYNQEKLAEEKAQITSEEISILLDSWSGFIYNGKEISSDIIRNWLNQFGNNKRQRLIFKILQNITVYSDYNVKQKMKEIYKHLLDVEKDNLIWTIEGRKKKRDDILVSYLESNLTKSGAEYARLFTDQNNILANNAVEKSKILGLISQENSNIKAIVFIDDFIGTGRTMRDNLAAFIEEFPEIRDLNIKIYIGVIAGFMDGKYLIDDWSTEFNINIDIFICNPLHDENKCFNDKSNIFPSPSEKLTAKDICYEFGVQLVKKDPFGFGDCQALVVFPNNCPNDSLPILWASKNEFKALFPRRM